MTKFQGLFLFPSLDLIPCLDFSHCIQIIHCLNQRTTNILVTVFIFNSKPIFYPILSTSTLFFLKSIINIFAFFYISYVLCMNSTTISEDSFVVGKRGHYLRQLAIYRAEGRPIYYMDETYCAYFCRFFSYINFETNSWNCN